MALLASTIPVGILKAAVLTMFWRSFSASPTFSTPSPRDTAKVSTVAFVLTKISDAL